MGYNVQAGEEPLVEQYPAGLRNKRLWCLISLVVIAAILFLITFGVQHAEAPEADLVPCR